MEELKELVGESAVINTLCDFCKGKSSAGEMFFSADGKVLCTKCIKSS